VQNLLNLADQRSRDVLMECTERDSAVVPFCPLGWPGEVRHLMLRNRALAALAGRLCLAGDRSSPDSGDPHPAPHVPHGTADWSVPAGAGRIREHSSS